jgi:ESX secretion system protein EccD
MSDFARVTVVGAHRRCDLAIPDDDVVAAVLPRLLELLGEAPGPVTAPPALVRATGEQLELDRTPAEQRLRDGELLRVVRADGAPPPPEVADVTDVLGDSLSERRGRWSDRARGVAGTLACGLVGVTASALLPAHLGAQSLWQVVAPLMAAAGLVLVATGLGLLGAGWGAAATTSAALGVCLPAVVRLGLPERSTATGWVLPIVTALGLCAWACLGCAVGVGLRRAPALAGSVVGLVATGVPLAASSAGPPRAAALACVVGVVMCGLLPRYAASAGGLTGLDDRVVGGQLRRRDEVQHTIDRAYASLTWSTFGVAGALVAPAGLLLASTDRWALALGVAVTAVTALRTRGFPLAAQQAALWGAVAGAVLHGLAGRPWPSAGTLGAVLAGLAAAVAAAVLVRPPDHVRAMLRKAGNALELVAVLALVPLVLGLFGVYADLLRAFS